MSKSITLWLPRISQIITAPRLIDK